MVGTPVIERPFRRTTCQPCTNSHRIRNRRYTKAVAVPHDIQEAPSAEIEGRNVTTEVLSYTPDTSRSRHVHGVPALKSVVVSPASLIQGADPPRKWEDCQWTYEELEYQSDLSHDDYKKERLVDNPRFANDMRLWAYLLDFRKRRYGDDAVLEFWTAVLIRGLELPMEGSIGESFWTTFLNLGLLDKKILSQICHYANKLNDNYGKRWPKLYVYVIQNIILEGNQRSLLHWHHRLIGRHAPGPEAFSRFARNVVRGRGDLRVLRWIYTTNEHRNIYGKIMPVLLEREDFKSALEMHYFLVSYGDLPSSQETVQRLIHHFAIYDPMKAVKLTKSLVDAGVHFPVTLPTNLETKEHISREMMNLIHGEAFHIEPKNYNDKLGARWLATKWISLDFAINALHALGVEAIGPLSLQAIALREPDHSSIVHRLDQLHELGISIGDSMYSKAIESFAKNRESDHLRSLLESDQHPDSLEDWRLQESLLVSYARAGDWAQYHRTVAIRLLGSTNPETERYNISLREYLSNGDLLAVLRDLEHMRSEGHELTPTTIRHMLKTILPPRRKGHITNPTRGHVKNLRTAIAILISCQKSNVFVPVKSWEEILRRLGMLGRLDELSHLCLWLAMWYKSGSSLRLQFVGNSTPSLPVSDLHLAPEQVPSSHHLHPLRVLFSDALQQSIAEWGFKHVPIYLFSTLGFSQDTTGLNKKPKDEQPHYLRGIELLRKLRQEGVYINIDATRRALMHRLMILHGPGESRVVRNRLLKQQNTVSLEDMVNHLNKTWREDIFPDLATVQKKIDVDSRRIIARKGRLRLIHRNRIRH